MQINKLERRHALLIDWYRYDQALHNQGPTLSDPAQSGLETIGPLNILAFKQSGP
jgi:hypothetical protein